MDSKDGHTRGRKRRFDVGAPTVAKRLGGWRRGKVWNNSMHFVPAKDSQNVAKGFINAGNDLTSVELSRRFLAKCRDTVDEWMERFFGRW